VTFQPGPDEFGSVCPYLGLADDADSHATYATEAHRCYRLPNPTRIATGHQETYCLGANHVSCPVYLGEGVPGVAAAAAGAAGAALPSRTPTPRSAPPQRETQDRGAAPARPRPPGSQGTDRGQRRPKDAGTVGPRPRAGGVSMPVATVGLFVLAIVVIALAFAINQLVGGDGGAKISPADTVGTQTAQKTIAAGGGGQQTRPAGPTTPATTQTPGTGQTPGSGQTPGAGTTPGISPTAGAGAKTHTVVSGDTCGAIAIDKNITLQQLLDANKITEADCSKLSVGQVLKLP
jgi:LysM repeat protein